MEIDPNLVANAKIAGAAAGGGLVRVFLRPARTLGQTALLLAACIVCGFYATAPLIDWWELPVDYAGAVGALAGFLGLSIAEGVLRAIDQLDFRALLSAWINKGK